MRLYFLIPYPLGTTYNNYMNNHFEFNNWDECKKYFSDIPNMEFIYINIADPKLIIDPDYENDYLLVCDIQVLNIKKYYEDYIHLFKKEKRFVFIYECLFHNIHQWKIDYVKSNFQIIFQNSNDLVSPGIFWIPCCNLFIKHKNYNSEKNNSCVVSPIYDLGFSENLDEKRIERIKIIKEYCSKESSIHVYGSSGWKNHIPLINFMGNIPGENEPGTYGIINLEEKIISKCKLLSKYKFVLVFENLFVNGYVTEKLVESLFSNSVVIYYGPPDIKEMYPYLFNFGIINGHDHTVSEILSIMKKMDNTEYNKRVQTIKLYRNKLNYENSSKNLKNMVMKKIKEVII